MTEAQQREAIKALGKTWSWINRVNAMTPSQVTAIYLSAKRRGIL